MSTVADRYELGPVIGVGASAVVHRARDLHRGEPVALKLFPRGCPAPDRRRQRRELRALRRLDHVGLVGLRDGGDADGRPYVVTDLVEGPSLAQRIAAGPIPPEGVRCWGRALAEALAHVHAGGLVHRDVKPANVLLGDGAHPRLTDFGIACPADAAAASTADGIMGTAAYLAPEQVRGEQVGPPADVYALGLVLLEAVTGRREYPGAAVESASARLHRRPDVPDGLPGGLTHLLRAMTEPDPADRPSTAQVARTLAPPARHRRPGWRGRRLVAAAVLVLTVGAGGAAGSIDAGHPAPPAAHGGR